MIKHIKPEFFKAFNHFDNFVCNPVMTVKTVALVQMSLRTKQKSNKNCSISFLTLVLIKTITIFFIASYGCPTYAYDIHPHGGLALTGYQDNIGVQSSLDYFVRNISMRSHVMAELERDTFECTGFLCCQSVNPFQLCHHYLTVTGKASIKNIGAHVSMPQINTSAFVLISNKKTVIL